MTGTADSSRPRIAKAAAQLLARVVTPATAFRATGVLPYVEAPTGPDILSVQTAPPKFDSPAPSASGGQNTWSTSKCTGTSRTHLASVPGGIAFPNGAVFDTQGRFLGLAAHDRDFADDPRRRWRAFTVDPPSFHPRIREFPHEVVVLTASNQGFYFHWIFDVLPRLWLAEQAGHEGGPFFIEADLPFQRQSLRALAVSESCLLGTRDCGAIRASNLIVPCHRIMPGHAFPEWSVEFLRSRLLPGTCSKTESLPKRLYVSRRNARHRRVRNEQEIVSFLERRGFQVVIPEELTFTEQVALFHGAEIVVAPHGGGLTNLVFCPSGAAVIELFPHINIDLYYRLATCLGLDYRFVKSRDDTPGFMGPEDYRIDVADLEDALDRARGRSN